MTMADTGHNPERYPHKANPHASHARIVALCGPGHNQSLVDVGCNHGVLTQQLAAAGWDTTGVEPDTLAAAVARSKGLDVAEEPAVNFFTRHGGDFDTIVFADSLEHMADPNAALKLARSRLAPGGRIVISLPNVAHLSVRLELLAGSFRYRDRGILDRTHLRFFTRRTFLELLDHCGLRPIVLEATPAPVEEALPRLRNSRSYASIATAHAAVANRWPTMFGYQFIAVAVPR